MKDEDWENHLDVVKSLILHFVNTTTYTLVLMYMDYTMSLSITAKLLKMSMV